MVSFLTAAGILALLVFAFVFFESISCRVKTGHCACWRDGKACCYCGLGDLPWMK